MIDKNRLAELEADFGADGLDEIIETFLAETWEGIDALEPMLSAEPSDARRDQFHFLKGCALNVGASEFGALCERLEAENGPFEMSDYRAMRDMFQAVCAALGGTELRDTA